MDLNFKGRALIDLPPEIPSYGFLEGSFGKEILKEYNSIVKQNYHNNSILNVLHFEDEVVKGSNSYSVFLMNSILSKYALRTVTPCDIQKIIDRDKDFLKGYCVNLGIVLRNNLAPENSFIYKFGKQAKDRNYEFSSSNPLVFKPSDLELIFDENAIFFGLSLKIKDSATPFNASELSYENNGKFFNDTDGRGMPLFEKRSIGSRTNLTGQDNLCCICMPKLDLDSSSDDLEVSMVSYDRIVLINDGNQ